MTDLNAASYIDAGASHVIVTSHVFNAGRLDETRLQELVTPCAPLTGCHTFAGFLHNVCITKLALCCP